MNDLSEIDVMVSTGGTYLVEQYRLWPRLFEFRLARILGVPVIFYTQSLGPFQERINRRTLRRVIEDSPLVLLRDARSRRHLLELGVPGDNLRVVADSVFAFAEAEPRFESRCEEPALRSVAISVRTWPPQAQLDDPAVLRFAGAIGTLVDWLVKERGVEVTFVSTCQGVPEYWTDDSRLAVRIAEGLPDDVRSRVHVDRSFRQPADLRDHYGSFDLVVSTRMHAAILALAAGTPVLPIAYEFKTREVFARMGLEEYVTDVGDVEGDRLVQLCARLSENLPRLRPLYARGVRAQRDEAIEAQQLLRQAIGEIR
jgi:colanic acid/amylovoran biosynthesis protein